MRLFLAGGEKKASLWDFGGESVIFFRGGLFLALGVCQGGNFGKGCSGSGRGRGKSKVHSIFDVSVDEMVVFSGSFSLSAFHSNETRWPAF